MTAKEDFQPRYILCLDSAMTGCAAALFDADNNKTIFRQSDSPRGQAEMLVPMAQDVIDEAGITFSQLDMVTTTIGPGSFTGLRIGISAARSFALALDVPLIGLTTTELLAAAFLKKKKTDHLIVLIETKRADYYVQEFDGSGAALGAPSSLMQEEIEPLIRDDSVIIGDAVNRFSAKSGGKSLNIDSGFTLPEPQIMGYVALQKITKGQIFDHQNINPIYLKAADVSQPKIKSKII